MKFITIDPGTSRGKFLVARKGAGDAYYVVAECRSQIAAREVADALNQVRAVIPQEAPRKKAA